MTACERASSLFGRAWDDELTVAERDGLERHFADCAPCRREYDELARTLELVQALPRPQVDDSFAVRVLAAAEARERAAQTSGRRWFGVSGDRGLPAFAFGRPALALAATFIVAAGVGAFLLNRPANEPSVPTVATVTPPPRDAAPTPSAPPLVAPATDLSTSDRMAVASAKPAPSARPRRDVVTPARTPGSLAAAAPTPAELDSLFDHSADVELVLDPVQLRRERGRGYTPSSPTVKGEAASITF